jgi:hypothetical protein
VAGRQLTTLFSVGFTFAIRFLRSGDDHPCITRSVPGSVSSAEQHQQPDGTVAVPEPLRAWVGTDVLRPQH